MNFGRNPCSAQSNLSHHGPSNEINHRRFIQYPAGMGAVVSLSTAIRGGVNRPPQVRPKTAQVAFLAIACPTELSTPRGNTPAGRWVRSHLPAVLDCCQQSLWSDRRDALTVGRL